MPAELEKGSAKATRRSEDQLVLPKQMTALLIIEEPGTMRSKMYP